MSNFLLDACKECLADRGRADDALAQRVHDFIHDEFEKDGKAWNYTLIDAVIDAFDKAAAERPEFRELDGIYFRIKRHEKWQNICFSDLTEEEMDGVLKGRNEKWLKSLCKTLGKRLREVGDSLDITCVEEEHND